MENPRIEQESKDSTAFFMRMNGHGHFSQEVCGVECDPYIFRFIHLSKQGLSASDKLGL